MLKHSPGPWRRDGFRGMSVQSADGRWVAEADDDMEEGDANARLIAAAPEMLALLRSVATHDGPVANVVPLDVVDAARALLARLDG